MGRRGSTQHRKFGMALQHTPKLHAMPSGSASSGHSGWSSGTAGRRDLLPAWHATQLHRGPGTMVEIRNLGTAKRLRRRLPTTTKPRLWVGSTVWKLVLEVRLHPATHPWSWLLLSCLLPPRKPVFCPSFLGLVRPSFVPEAASCCTCACSSRQDRCNSLLLLLSYCKPGYFLYNNSHKPIQL